MKKIALIILMLAVNISFAQNETNKIIDSLNTELIKAKEDTSKVNILNQLTSNNFYQKPKIATQYGIKALKLASKINWKKGMAIANNNLGICYWVDADYPESIKYFKKTLLCYKNLKNLKALQLVTNMKGL